MQIDAAQLAAMIASRVCHDLVSPVAALNAGLEILDEGGNADMREQSMALIRTSTEQLMVKLEFLRAALGSATTGEGDFDLGEVRNLSAKFFSSQKPELVWSLAPARTPRAAARLLMNLLLVAADCLPRGGTVEVTGGQTGEQVEYVVSARGPRALMKPGVRAGLAGQTPEEGFDGRSIQPYLAFLTAAGAKAELAARESEERVDLIVRMTAPVAAY
jgi:histidine phosphotransferase ChpT